MLAHIHRSQMLTSGKVCPRGHPSRIQVEYSQAAFHWALLSCSWEMGTSDRWLGEVRCKGVMINWKNYVVTIHSEHSTKSKTFIKKSD